MNYRFNLRLNDSTFYQLEEAARKNNRTMNQQAITYIQDGLLADLTPEEAAHAVGRRVRERIETIKGGKGSEEEG